MKDPLEGSNKRTWLKDLAAGATERPLNPSHMKIKAMFWGRGVWVPIYPPLIPPLVSTYSNDIILSPDTERSVLQLGHTLWNEPFSKQTYLYVLRR